MKLSEPRCVAPSGDWCGEGPLWCAEEQAVYWVDINRFLIHRLWRDGSVRSWFFEEPVTSLVLTGRSGTLAVVLGSRVIFWNPAPDERRDQGFRLPGWPAVRFNDARCDPRGSLWAGSMRNNVAPDGSAREAGGNDGVLLRLDPDGGATEFKNGIGISNTMAWSPDSSRFYTADTLANVIYRYDYNLTNGNISGEQIFLAGFERGAPDGSVVDNQGYLWNCRHGGGCIVRVAPDGAVDRIVEMPTPNVTSCIFGGPDLTTLYVTSAFLGAPQGDRLAGSLFAIETGIAGLPANKFQ